MPTDTWTLWGHVDGTRSTLDAIKVLQAEGHRVRVVKVGNRNDLYINELPGPEAA